MCGQKKALYSPELELKVVCESPDIRGTELRSFERIASTVNGAALSLVPQVVL